MEEKNNAPALTLGALVKQPEITSRFADILNENAPAFLSTVIAVAKGNAQLQLADPLSVLTAAMTAATLNLPVSPSLGYAALVPYKTREGVQCQLQIMTRGYVQLALRSGQFVRLEAQPVHEGEIAGLNRFTGEITFAAPASEKVIGYLAYMKLRNGFEKFLLMTIQELEQHAKRYSQTAAKGFGLWKDNFDAMAKKTVLKLLLARWAPLSSGLMLAVERDGVASTKMDVATPPLRAEYVDGAAAAEAAPIQG